jgi:hypothetical protein
MRGLLLAILVLSGPVAAQDYPQRPIRMVIPFPAGGSIDVIGRSIAQNWSVTLGQQIVIDNRGGAGGTLGTDLVAKAQPDGYTILYGNSGPLSIGPLLYKKLGYDLFRDLAPVSQSVSSPFVVFATQSLPPNNAAELIAYAKERPNQINYASSGVGSGLHLVGELFQSVTGTKLVHVPFKGISQALSELFTGRVQLAMSTTAGLAPHVRAGRMKGHRQHRPRTVPATSGSADLHRGRAARLLRQLVACDRRPRWHARGGSQQASADAQDDAGECGVARATACARRCDRRREHAGGSREIPERGIHPMGGDHQGGRRQGRMTTRTVR